MLTVLRPVLTARTEPFELAEELSELVGREVIDGHQALCLAEGREASRLEEVVDRLARVLAPADVGVGEERGDCELDGRALPDNDLESRSLWPDVRRPPPSPEWL